MPPSLRKGFEASLSPEGKNIFSAIKAEMEKLRDDFANQMRLKDEEVTTLKEEVCSLRSTVQEVTTLKEEVSYLRGRVEALTEKIDDGDAYERRDTLLISGDGLPPVAEGEDTSAIARDLIKEKLKINLQTNDISTSHRLGRKPASQGPDKRKIVLKLCRRDLKKDILFASKSLRPNIYVNESLSPTRNTILFTLRKMRRLHPSVIKGSCSLDGRVFAWLAPDPNSDRSVKVLVNNREKLRDLAVNNLGKTLEDFIPQWPH